MLPPLPVDYPVVFFRMNKWRPRITAQSALVIQNGSMVFYIVYQTVESILSFCILKFRLSESVFCNADQVQNEQRTFFS